MLGNCHEYVYRRQRERMLKAKQAGGVIILMPSEYFGPPVDRWWWRPFYLLFGALAQFCWWRCTGVVQHAVWAPYIGCPDHEIESFHPEERKWSRVGKRPKLRDFPLMFPGHVRTGLGKRYARYYGGARRADLERLPGQQDRLDDAK